MSSKAAASVAGAVAIAWAVAAGAADEAGGRVDPELARCQSVVKHGKARIEMAQTRRLVNPAKGSPYVCAAEVTVRGPAGETRRVYVDIDPAGDRFGVAISVPATSSGGNESGADARARTALDVVHEYVSRTRGWDRGQYRIEEKGGAEGLTEYWVVHREDERRPRGGPGGGQSFAVRYDPLRRQVVRELAFQ